MSGILFYMGKLFLGIAFLLCITSLSVFAQREKTDPLKVGDIAPDFSLAKQEKQDAHSPHEGNERFCAYEPEIEHRDLRRMRADHHPDDDQKWHRGQPKPVCDNHRKGY